MFRRDHLGSPAGESHPNGSTRHASRPSIESNLHHGGEGSNDGVPATPSRPASLHSSHSMSEVPVAGEGSMDNAATPPGSHAELSNPYVPRTPHQTRDSPQSENPGSQGQHTALQASAAPFGPQVGTAEPTMGISSAAVAGGPAPFQGPYYGYGLPPYMGNQMQAPAQYANYNTAGPYGAYPPYGNYRPGEGTAKGAGRRGIDADNAQLSRFANYPLEHYEGELYSLCKDQHGCRYLQRKLEERTPEQVQMIFDEIRMHVVELMTGRLSTTLIAITSNFCRPLR